MTDTLDFDTVKPVDISINNLTISLKHPSYKFGRKKSLPEKVPIIQDVSATIKSGVLMAILGGSGSGKTTLLNALAGRIANLEQTGDILFNNQNPKDLISKGFTGYVQQNDYLMPYLTVRETLQYAAELRLPKSLSKAKKYVLVEKVILELGLKECADIVIGNDWRRGVSGGEKRRVTIGCQLLTNPSVLFLDEPTTGLDSFTARHLVSTLVNLARRGRTVIISIHQPRSDIFKMFDRIILLSRGNVVYSGPTSQVVPYFQVLGFPCPEHVNPGDHLIDISSVDNRTPGREKFTKARLLKLTKAWSSEPKTEESESHSVTKEMSAVRPVEKIKTAGFLSQCVILIKRELTNISRDSMQQWGNLTGAVSIAVVLGLIFLRLPIDQVSTVQSLKTITYIYAVMRYYLGMILWIYKFSIDLNVFDREREDKMYCVSSYLIAGFFSQLPANIIYPTIYAVILYFLVGLRTDDLAAHIFIFIAVNILMQLCTMGYASVCAALAPGRSFSIASLIGNAVSIFFFLTAGYVLNYSDIPVYIRWFQYVNYYAFAYRITVVNELRNYVLPCVTTSAQCDGNVALESLHISPETNIGIYFGSLIAFYFTTMVITGILLSFVHFGGVKHATKLADRRKNDILEDNVIITEKNDDDIDRSKPLSQTRRVDLQLRDINLNIIKKRIPGLRDRKEISILRNINATFPAGQVSVILGSSGSGKSSLLHLISCRPFSAGPFAEFQASGSITFNGSLVTPQKVRAKCAFVHQDDHYHLAALTVRETLRYAAMLRLPPEMNKEVKYAHAEKVLCMLGLKDCADIVVGGELLKGISGGEKRRLSLAVQMISDPDVLVIDEPTSGLDAFIAMGIMQTLKELANSGRTIICSIHQPRSDIFDQTFDNILLLTRGGRVAYSGDAKDILTHFDSIGLQCPALFNPADFLIDETSIDLRNSEAEKQTSEQVEKILSNWKETEARGLKRLSRIPVLDEFHTDAPTESMQTAPESFQDSINESVNEDAETEMMASAVSSQDLESGEDTATPSKNYDSTLAMRMAPMRIALPVIVDRSLRNMWRQKDTFFTRIIQTPAMGLSLWIFYLRLNQTATGAQNRIGLIQENISIMFVGMLNAIAIYPQERNLFFHEYVSSPYSVSTFLLGFLLIEVPFEILASLLFSVIVNIGFGMQTSIRIFFQFFFTIFALVNAGESVGIAFASLFTDIGLSVNLISTALALLMQMSGIVSANVPDWLQKINYISVAKYAANIQAINEFHNLEIECTPEEIKTGVCVAQNGDELLAIFGFEVSQLNLYIGLFVAATFAYRLLAWLILWGRMKVNTK